MNQHLFSDKTWHGVVIKAGKDWRGSGGLKLQCIRNCHVFKLFLLSGYVVGHVLKQTENIFV